VPARRAPSVLYISYDGALEPLGQSQVLPYLRGLSSRGAAITLISFEKPADAMVPGRIETLRAELAGQRIRWIPVRFHARPRLLAKPLDLLLGMVRAGAAVTRDRVHIIHARSYVAALIAWLLTRVFRVRFIFDMRGFWADERVEGGLWPADGLLYRLAKRLERRFVEDADTIVTLTERARLTVEGWARSGAPQVVVVPTCVDLVRFPRAERTGRADDARVFVYAGSLGTWYLLDEMLRFIEEARARCPRTRMLIVTRDREAAAAGLSRSRLAPERVTIVSAASAEMPTWLREADAGLAFYKPGWGRQGTCPTKVGEYLATGLPVVVNDAVGDMGSVVTANRVGVALSQFTPEARVRALDELHDLWSDASLAARCRHLAESYFSLDVGVDRYWDVYRRLASFSGPPHVDSIGGGV